ncbi:MAG: hypothetical protein Salg2KO_05070 [Salibacteraceae bacterium]
MKVAVYLLMTASALMACNNCLEGDGPRTSRFMPLDSVSEFYLDVVGDAVVKVDSSRSNVLEIIAQ